MTRLSDVVTLRLSRLDALLVLMTVIWGSNYTIIKSAFREIPPVAFNGLRLMIASVLFLLAIWRREPRARLAPRDWLGILALATVGQFFYQLLFITGLAHTSVANSALLLGCTPIFVALMTAALGHERLTPAQWGGAFVSVTGLYFIVGHGAGVTSASARGDLMMLGAVLCWSAATVGSRPLLARYSPLVVTGYSMAIGTLLYAPLGWIDLQGLAWREVSRTTWLSLAWSAAMALCVAYMIWYTAVQRLGNTRTAAYSNLVPVVAMLTAWLWLGEGIGAVKLAGAAAVLAGVGLTRLQPRIR